MDLKRSVYAFKGESGSGKSLAAQMFVCMQLEQAFDFDYFIKHEDYLPVAVSFADPLKEFLSCSLSIPLDCFYDKKYKDDYFLKLPERSFANELSDFEHVYNVQDFVDNNGLNNINGYTKIRYIMQYVGTELIKNKFWSKAWINNLFYSRDIVETLVIDDCRFKDESDAVYERNGICIRIIRKQEFLNKYKHSSEQIYEDNRDIVIVNDGTKEDLFNKIKKLIEDEKE